MPSPKRRAPVYEPAGSGPTMAQRRVWADQHEDLHDRLVASGLLQPGDPHYTCHHLRMDDPAWRPARRSPRGAAPAWPNLAPGDDAA